ncbi:MAG: SGNH/GDSL hydrolase family protein [Pseudomonadota bacterium]
MRHDECKPPRRRSGAFATALSATLLMSGPALASPAPAASAAGDMMKRAEAAEAPLRVALLGTSLTRRGGWDRALEAALSECLGRPVEALNFAGSGMTSRWGLTQVAAVRAARPDVVAVEFSANDASILKGFSIDESAANARRILEELRPAGGSGGAEGPALILMAMNPIHGIRGWIRPWLDHYYDAYAPLAAEVGAAFLDLRPSWRALGAGGLRRAIPDGAHPRPEVAASIVAPALARVIAHRKGGSRGGSSC